MPPDHPKLMRAQLQAQRGWQVAIEEPIDGAMLNTRALDRFVDLGDGLVAPIMDDYTFAALAPTIEYLSTGSTVGPLLPVDCFGGAYPVPKRIVTILVDAFGYAFWQRYASASKIMSHMLANGVVSPISALFPSTTAASVSTLNLGVPPSEHALYEWNVYIPAYGETIQSLAFATLGAKPVACEALGYDPRALLTTHETIHTRLAREGVTSIQLAHATYAQSAYNRIIGADADVRPHATLAEALSHLRAILERPPVRRELIGFYWAGLDTVAHMAGPASAAFDDAVLAFWGAMDEALHGLRVKDTLFLVTADHGHVGADEPTIYVNERFPALADCLASSPQGQTIWPNGSPRDMFLHVCEGRRKDVLEQLQVGLRDDARVMTTDTAVDLGLFGHGSIHPELRRRIGDILVLPKPGRFVWWHVPGLISNPFVGHHGGLSREEMTTVVAVSDRL